jgi:hypothetical protein
MPVKVEIFESPGTLTEQDLAVFEAKIGQRFPDDYRQFLKQYNGGRPEPRSFSEQNGKPCSSVHYFLSVNGKEFVDMIEEIRSYAGRLPTRFTPIAYDSFGNVICLSMSGDDRGAVYFWDHEREADETEGESPETIGNVTLIANSFSEFLDGLR